jgi:hypothetical protein
MKRYKYNLSNYQLSSGNLGYLLPIGLKEVIPGDTFDMSTSVFMRLSTLVTPVMHPMHIKIHHWFVPHRLIFDGFEKWFTGGSNGTGDGVSFPTILHAADATTLITGYQGLGRTSTGTMTISALPVRGYNLIWDKFYRDQQVDTGWTDPYAEDQLIPQRVRWAKDFYTTARTSEELGDEVAIPLFDDIPLSGFGKLNQTYGLSNQAVYETDASATTNYVSTQSDNATFMMEEDPNNTGYPNMRVESTNANNPASIKDLREAMALHRRREIRNKYGHRYEDVLRGMGIRNNRLSDLPEYLGGGKQTVSITDIAQTAEGTGTVVGELKGAGTAALRTNRFRRFFNEHGFIHSMAIVQPINIWQSSCHRAFFKMARNQFYQPEYDGIGMDPIYVREVYGDSTDMTTVLGYQHRYDDYRSDVNRAVGEFRTDHDNYHLGPQYSSDPALNSDFLKCDPRLDAYADATEENFKGMVYHRCAARRIVKPRR